MPLIQFPNVPQVAGVPSLVRSVVSSVVSVVGGLLSGDAFNLPRDTVAPVWGLFGASGAEVFQADTVLAFGIQNQTRVSDFPIENGAFTSYNKTGSPFEIRIRMVKGGSESERSAFIDTFEVELQSTNLYTVVTPEATYSNATLEAYDYRRETRNGAGCVIVDLSLREIRLTAVAQFTSAEGSQTVPLAADEVATDSAASPQNIGQVQPAEPTMEQAAAIPPPVSSPTPPAALPAGYTQDPRTGLVMGPDGQINRDLSAPYFN